MAGNITVGGMDGGADGGIGGGADDGADDGTGGDIGGGFGDDFAGRLAKISSRTSLMAIDAILRVAPADPTDPFPVATAGETVAEVRSVARRMLQATRDFRATVQQPAE